MGTIAITNQKGGTGKTTTTINLAAALAEKRRSVLILDLDPQASATACFGIRPTGKGIFDALTGNVNLADLIANTGIKGLDIIPASTWLVGAERLLSGEVGAELIVREKLKRARIQYDFILIDNFLN